MKFIKLTLADDRGTAWFNAEKFLILIKHETIGEEGITKIVVNDGEPGVYHVEESPEEIFTQIREAS